MADRRRRAPLPRLRRRHRRRRRSATAIPAPLAAAHAQLDRLWHVSNLYWTEPMAAARRAALRAVRRRAGVLLQLRRRGDRGGAQVRAQGDRASRASSRSRARSTDGPSARSRSPASPQSKPAFEPLLPGVTFARLNDVGSLEQAVGSGHGPDPARAGAGRGRRAPGGAGVPRRRRRSSRTSTGRSSASTRCRPASAGPARSSPSSSSACGRTSSRSRRGSRTGCRSARCSRPTTHAAGFVPGDHASTFGGNPVVCAAACAVVEAVDEELLAARPGARARSSREALPVRGRRPAPRARRRTARREVVAGCLDAGLLVTSAGARVRPPDPAADRHRRGGRAGDLDPAGGHRMSTHRRERQGAILRLVRERQISTQAELAEALHEAGYDAVQTTVSRDVSELGLVKVRASSGRLVYAPAGAADRDRLRELELALRRWGALRRGQRPARRRLHAARLRRRARGGDRRGRPSARARHRRGRQHHPRRSGRRREGVGPARRVEQHLLEGAA